MGDLHVVAANLDCASQFFAARRDDSARSACGPGRDGPTLSFILKERRGKFCFRFSVLVQIEKSDAAIEMKNKTIGCDRERSVESFVGRLVIAQLHVLNAEAVERGNKLRMDRESAFELLDRLVSLTCFN